MVIIGDTNRNHPHVSIAEVADARNRTHSYYSYRATNNGNRVGTRYRHSSDQHPALVYLASLGAGSRRTMRQALNTVADILTVGRCDHLTLPWGALRFQHTQAVRAILQERYSAATANKMFAALKQTLKFAWQLGYMSGGAYQQAVSITDEGPAGVYRLYLAQQAGYYYRVARSM